MEKLLEMFPNYIGKRIALYGLGVETPKVLNALEESFDVVGLLDGFEVTGEMYGKSIISLAEAINQGIELVIVVARPGSCKAIAKRIGDTCKANGVEVFDVRGNNLLEKAQVMYDLKALEGYTKAELLEKIADADAVSFDLFDTLITRNILFPTDVIDCVQGRLREMGIFIPDFQSRRLGAEKKLSKGYSPKLCEIYANVLAGEDVVSATDLAEIEYETDLKLLVPRKDMVSVLMEAKGMGKSVYITSDTYYNKRQILKILEKCGIENFDDVLASCEYGTGKTGALFQSLIQIAETANILHIGDDAVADVQGAGQYGIKSFRIYSGQECLDAVGGLGLNEHVETLADRIKVGMFVASMFNSPFLFENEERRFIIPDAYDVGYLFCAPMITDFVQWFYRRINEEKISNVWLGARDGYLIQKMSKVLEPENDSVYFLASRMAAIRAGVVTADDIRYVDEMKYGGSLEENLLKRFGIDANELAADELDVQEKGLLRYKNAILSNAEQLRANYQKYIALQRVKNGEIAFFDFVAKGTVQLYLSKLVDAHMKGFYFLQLERQEMQNKNLDIEAFYSPEESAGSVIYDNYYILETLLTSPHASVCEFDENGNPIYADETRQEADIACAMRAQDGILDYYINYLSVCPQSEQRENKCLDEIFLALIHNVKIQDKDFLNLFVEDPFFNRMTHITDVL